MEKLKLDIPGFAWTSDRWNSLKYGVGEFKHECFILKIFEDETGSICLSLHTRKGFDYAIRGLHLPYWEKETKKLATKITDGFLRRYDKKLQKMFGLDPSTAGYDDYWVHIYTLN